MTQNNRSLPTSYTDCYLKNKIEKIATVNLPLAKTSQTFALIVAIHIRRFTKYF